MNDHKILIATTLLLMSISTLSLMAQKDIPFEKDYFKDRKPEFKAALKELELGDEFYMQGKDYYNLAMPHYLEANKFNPNSSDLNFKIGKCYLLRSNYKVKSLYYFGTALTLNPNIDPEIHYYLGRGYHYNSEWDKAINEYTKYQRSLGPNTPVTRVELVKKLIKECNNGKEMVKNPKRVFIDNLPGQVNSRYPEYGAIITADESMMMFTSRRNNSTGGKVDPLINEYFEDIYISYNQNGQWSVPQNAGKPINSDGHDATVALSPDGTRLIIYLDDKGDGNLYECVLKGAEWSKPKKLGKNVNTDYHESSACYGPDGKTLYFVSDKSEDNFGLHDIYITHWDEEKERWGPATNLGPMINTKYDERSVFIHPDGRTLYFSSEGHSGMGELDVYKSVLENGTWSKPENMGYPINTPDDDVFFVLAANGKHGYYSSFNPDGKGEKDIYMITFLGPEKPLMMNSEDNLIASLAQPIKETVIEPKVVVSRNRVTILKGIVRNAVTLQPLEANIELIDNEKNEMVARFSSNSTTGKYLVSLPSGRNYGVAVKAEGYLFHSENFNIPESAAYKEVVKNFDLKKIEVGSSIVLNNIFFDFDKATLRPESKAELANLEKVMTQNPTIKVEISGHTDNKGSDAYNQQLSEKRAKAVVDYLVGKGISASRMVYKGYGESKPIESNDTDEGRQMNRRTEFKILSK